MKLSHSQINIYSTCGQRYKHHYIDKLRDPITSAALLFGTALDNTVNTILQHKKLNNVQELITYQELFKKIWSFGEINKQVVAIRKSALVVYAESDFDAHLLTEAISSSLGFSSLDKMLSFYKMITFKKKAEGINNLSSRELECYNTINWECLLVKGSLMLESYYKEVLPLIKDVLAIQKEIALSNNEDAVTGFIDAILDFGDGPVICDLKTSSIIYEYGSASTSPQLAIYKHAVYDEYKTNKTAFIVLYKRMQHNSKKVCSLCSYVGESRAKTCDAEINGKRCGGVWNETTEPKAKVELIKGVIDDTFEDNVVGNYDVILKGIKAGVFYKNWNSCKQSYGICPYFSMCHNKGVKHLIKVE